MYTHILKLAVQLRFSHDFCDSLYIKSSFKNTLHTNIGFEPEAFGLDGRRSTAAEQTHIWTGGSVADICTYLGNEISGRRADILWTRQNEQTHKHTHSLTETLTTAKRPSQSRRAKLFCECKRGDAWNLALTLAECVAASNTRPDSRTAKTPNAITIRYDAL